MASVMPDFLRLQETGNILAFPTYYVYPHIHWSLDIDVDNHCNYNIPQYIADVVGHTAYFMQMFPWRTGMRNTTL